MTLEDKKTLITGAGDGIGKAIALKFSQLGATLVINDINEETGRATADQINAAGGEAAFVQGDIGDPADVDKMINFALEANGRIDVLVNNAAVEENAPFHLHSKDMWDRIIKINLTGTFMVAQAAVNQMLTQGGGVIVNLASGAGLVGFPTLAAYTASKHGVVGLTKVMALELRDHNIRVNAICPSFIDTAMAGRIVDFCRGAGLPIEEIVAGLQGRMGKAEEVAGLAAFLASDEASFINGTAIPVDNGTVAQ